MLHVQKLVVSTVHCLLVSGYCTYIFVLLLAIAPGDAHDVTISFPRVDTRFWFLLRKVSGWASFRGCTNGSTPCTIAAWLQQDVRQLR